MKRKTWMYWLNKLLDCDFKGREYILTQLPYLEVESTYVGAYISIIFKVTGGDKFPYNKRVPVDMIAYQLDNVPAQFMLHIIDGWVKELEIFAADGGVLNQALFSFEKVDYYTYDDY